MVFGGKPSAGVFIKVQQLTETAKKMEGRFRQAADRPSSCVRSFLFPEFCRLFSGFVCLPDTDRPYSASVSAAGAAPR